MAHPHHHALSSVKKWGGTPSDYEALHEWFDASKAHCADFRHRALRHHSEGIFMLEALFGKTITLSTGRIIPTRWVGEQHVQEDLGCIPTWADWCRAIRPQPWMARSAKLSVEFANHPANSPAPIVDEADDTTNDIGVKRARSLLDAYASARLMPVSETPDIIADAVAVLFAPGERQQWRRCPHQSHHRPCPPPSSRRTGR